MEFLKETIDYFIFAVLGFMGFVALWLTIERLLFLRKVPTFWLIKKFFSLLSLELHRITRRKQLSAFVGNYFIGNFNRSFARIVEAVSTALSGSMPHARRMSSQSVPSVFFSPFSSVAKVASASRLLQVYK